MEYIRIGYWGIKGSNTDHACQFYIKENQIENVLDIPLHNTKMGIEKLKDKELDYFILPIENTTTGDIKENKIVLEDRDFEVVDTFYLPIEHSLFVKDKRVKNIDYIISHEQALKQCKKTISRMFKEAKLISELSTAFAAKQLSEGKYNKNTAVICSEITGKMYDLCLFKKGIQDADDNQTLFCILKNKKS